jgi:hypothetical protein
MTSPGRVRRLAPRAAVIAVLGAALLLEHGEVFRAGSAQVVPLAPGGSESSLHPFRRADVTFEAWLAARNARTLLRQPWRLFETPHCAPATHTLTLGPPVVALGVLGMPAAAVDREPLRVYNQARVAASAVCAVAMYALVTGWTRRRAAGLAAALLFAFHPIRQDLASHPPEWDIAWTALALWFAQRLFEEGRWRDAAGLALCVGLQIAASFYALLAAALLSLPLVTWLVVHRAARRVSATQLAVVAACAAIAAALLLGPYLAARRAGAIGGRTLAFYAPWRDYAPGGRLFPGAAVASAALLGLAVPRRVALPGLASDPRPALAGAAIWVAFVAAGSTSAASLQQWGLPVPDFDPYALLARVLPGLDSVRDVTLLSTAVYLVSCVLAGAGFAAAIDGAGRWGSAASVAFVALAAFVCFGFGPKPWLLVEARPSQASIEFFEKLGRLGNDGPLLELPLDSVQGAATLVDAQRTLLSAWHGRRTSACFASFPAPGHERLEALVPALPDRDAVDALARLGFTTVIAHHPPGLDPGLDQQFAPGTSGSDPALRLIARSDAMSAYALVPR